MHYSNKYSFVMKASDMYAVWSAFQYRCLTKWFIVI